MRALVQRVAWAEVEVEAQVIGRIEGGLLVYVGVAATDAPANVAPLAEKVANLRIFPDEEDKLNRSVLDVGGAVLAISNFTLLADARKGRRPAFNPAAGRELAEPLHEAFVAALRGAGCRVQTGRFGADMTIRSAAAGPVNLILDYPPAP
jgi:D-tyrosyl-tRNA(Tyr) deacylase